MKKVAASVIAVISVVYLVVASFAVTSITIHGNFVGMGAGNGVNEFETHLTFVKDILVRGTAYSTTAPQGSYSTTTIYCSLINGKWITVNGVECSALEGKYDVRNLATLYSLINSGDISQMKSLGDSNCYRNYVCYIK